MIRAALCIDQYIVTRCSLRPVIKSGETEYMWMTECLECERNGMKPWMIATISGGAVLAVVLLLYSCCVLSRRRRLKKEQPVGTEFDPVSKPGRTTV